MKNTVDVTFLPEMMGSTRYENVRVAFFTGETNIKSWPDEPTLWLNPAHVKAILIQSVEEQTE